MTQNNDNFYRAFEDRHRGPRELIKSRLQVYRPFVEPLKLNYAAPTAIDLGCGRGEWLELVNELGYEGVGVDLDEAMLAACHDRGLKVECKEAIAYLKSLPDANVAIVSAFHVAEHIAFDELQNLVQEALRVLLPGGLLILETPNPENIVVGSCNFYLDPTHRQPIPSQLLSFLPEHYGFARTKILRLQESVDLSGERVLSLMDVLGGASPDYAVVAQKVADESILAATGQAFEPEYGISLEALADKYDNHTKAKTLQAETTAHAAEAEARAAVAEARTQQAEAEARAAVAEARTQQAEAEARAAVAEARTQQAEARTAAAEVSLEASRKELNEVHQANHHHWQLAEARLSQVAIAQQTMEIRLIGIETQMHAKKTQNISMMVRDGIIRPLLLAANKIIRSHPRLKQKLSFWLFRKFPEFHYQLRRLVNQEEVKDQPYPQLIAEPATVQSTIDKSATVLLDPALSSLERPVIPQTNATDSNAPANSNEKLESLVELSQMRQSNASVCFVVPINQIDHDALQRTIQSVVRQTDPAWELLLCASGNYMALTEDWLDVDWRIRRLEAACDTQDMAPIIRAAVHATTKFVGLLSQGDMVDDDLVKRIGQTTRNAPQTDVVYTDEIQQFDDGTLGRPFYKPDWSPEHQCSVDMLGRFVAVRKNLLLDQPPPKSSVPAAIEYELNLAVTRRARQIAHIDDALYIRRSTLQPSIGGFFPKEALAEAESTLEQHLRAENVEVRVVARPGGSLHVKWPLPKDLAVTLLILTGMHVRELPGRGKVVLATNFVRSIIEKSSFDRYKIIVVDDGYVPDDLRDLLNAHGHTTHTYPKTTPFSFANKANFASSLVSSGIVILLNDDLEVISPDWIGALASQVARPSIGAAGGRLLFADGSLQHAGIAMGFHGSAGHMFHRATANGNEYAGFASIERNYSAVTGAVLAYRKEVFDEIGGFDEKFQTDYNDLDFCLRCIEQGYRIVYTPAATLYHFHNSSLKRMNDKESERQEFLARWKHVVSRDPYFSKHFQIQSSDLPLLRD